LKELENDNKRLRQLLIEAWDLCPVKTEVDALRKTVEALRAMIEVRPDGSASWRIPRMKNER